MEYIITFVSVVLIWAVLFTARLYVRACEARAREYERQRFEVVVDQWEVYAAQRLGAGEEMKY